MAGDSGQKFIRRNRPPRVHITYEDPYNAEQKIELPFVMGVMADLSGNASAVEKPEISQRKFLDFDMDNFDQRMAAIEPAVTFNVPNKLGEDENEKREREEVFRWWQADTDRYQRRSDAGCCCSCHGVREDLRTEDCRYLHPGTSPASLCSLYRPDSFEPDK